PVAHRRRLRACRCRTRELRRRPRIGRVQAGHGTRSRHARAHRARLVKLSHTALVRAPRARVWKLVTDVPAAARCVPGVAAVTPSTAGKYKGSLLVQLGPVRLVLDGDVALTATDEAAGKASV